METLDVQEQLADQRRGRYVRVSDVDRRQLIDAYKKNEDFIALAKKLNIKRSTARSILRTFIDEGRVSAKQRAGTRLRFITEEEAEIIREMKRRHPLITIGQIQMRLQRTSNRVLSKASISRILTNSIRLGKRAKRCMEGEEDGQDEFSEKASHGQDELAQLSSDEGTGGVFYIDDEDEDDDDDEDEDGVLEKNSSLQNLDDFQRFIFRKGSTNGDEPMTNEGPSWNNKESYEGNEGNIYDGNYPISYPNFGSEDDDDELSEMDGNESKSPTDVPSEVAPNPEPINGDTSPSPANHTWNGNQTSVKAEPVCVFLNQNYDSSDSEQQSSAMEERVVKIPTNHQSTAHRRIKMCPICGEKNFSRLSHHLTVAHNMNREESLTLLAHSDRPLIHPSHSMIATVSGSSPKTISTTHLDKSPQPTPISINTNNQQITSASASPPVPTIDTDNHSSTITHISPTEHPAANYSPVDGKKRLLCPRCDTWVLNLTDHLIKKHHLLSKQERLPFLRMARNRPPTGPPEKPANNGFVIPSDHLHSASEQQKQTLLFQQQVANNRKYQNIIKKYRKKSHNQTQPSSSSHNAVMGLSAHDLSSSNINHNLMTMNNIQSLLNNSSQQEKYSPASSRTSTSTRTNGNHSTATSNKDAPQVVVHQKFEQRLSVFRQQFAVTVAMQNSLMQQMELLQRSFVSIEEEWNDMKKEIVASIS